MKSIHMLRFEQNIELSMPKFVKYCILYKDVLFYALEVKSIAVHPRLYV
jgi:hypothetical protein